MQQRNDNGNDMHIVLLSVVVRLERWLEWSWLEFWGVPLVYYMLFDKFQVSISFEYGDSEL